MPLKHKKLYYIFYLLENMYYSKIYKIKGYKVMEKIKEKSNIDELEATL